MSKVYSRRCDGCGDEMIDVQKWLVEKELQEKRTMEEFERKTIRMFKDGKLILVIYPDGSFLLDEEEMGL